MVCLYGNDTEENNDLFKEDEMKINSLSNDNDKHKIQASFPFKYIIQLARMVTLQLKFNL